MFGPEVGRGAYGQVLVGEDAVTGERVAIKRIVERGDDPAELERFFQESRLLAQLQSPHVVRYIADGVDASGCPCLVLEWLDGQSLTARQKTNPLSVAEACEVTLQIAVGLESLHRLGIVHRDIKPSNLFVRNTPEGTLHATILDLGAARVWGDAALTVVGSLVGTPAYMAPEQARGERTLTAHADLFSLGLVLFELLAGKRAFEGPPHAVLAQILLGDLPDISQVVDGLHPMVVRIVQTCLARDRSDRFVSASALATALREVLALGMPTQPPQRRMQEHGRELHPASVRSDVATGVISAQSTPSRSLGAAERRLVCALFASFEHASEPAEKMQAFCDFAASRNADTFTMVGARCAAVFALRRATTDAIINAARTGLSLRKELGEGAFALVSCRIVSDGNALAQDAIERAMELLEIPTDGLVVDAVSATLLSAQFVVEDAPGHKVLRGEQLARREGPPKLLGYQTTTVGRDRELSMLDSTLQECLEGPASKVVLVSAPAGRGKSRLCWEWTERLRTRFDAESGEQSQQLSVIVAMADPNGAGVALGLLGQVVRRAAAIHDSDPLPVRREKLRARVATTVTGSDLPRITAFLGELAGAHFASESSAQLQAARADRMLMADQIRRAWNDWLRAETSTHGMLIVVEDVHWADAPSLSVLDNSLALCNDSALMVAAFARPEVHEVFPGLFEARSVLEIRLGELRKKDAEALIRSVLGSVDEHTLKHLIERAAGNPFVLEELIRAAFVGQTAGLPQTVLAVADARLQTLAPEARRVLRLASVLGAEFWPSAVQSLMGAQSEVSLVSTLASLEKAEMITRRSDSRFSGESQFAFRHALLRDAAYAMLTEEDRTTAHCLAGQWLEQAKEPDPVRIAEHFERGARPDRAAAFFAQTATEAMERCDLAAVLTFAEKSLACGVDDASAGELWLLRAEAHRWRGENPDALNAAGEALDRLPPGCDAWFRAVMERLQAAGRVADKSCLSSTAKSLLAIQSRRVSGAEAMACAKGVVQLSHHGYHDAAASLLQRLSEAEASGEAHWDARVRGTILIAQGMVSHGRGELGQFARTMSDAATLLEEAGDLRAASMQRVNVGYAYSQLGALEAGEHELRTALGVAVRLGLRDVEGMARSNLALVLGHLGRVQQAEEEGLSALAGFRAQSNRTMISVTLLYIAHARLEAGDATGAQSYAEQAYEAAANPAMRAASLGVLSRIQLALKQPEVALESARQAMGILEIVRAIEDFDLLIYLGFIESLFACGLYAEAEDALRSARDLVQSRLTTLGDETIRERAAKEVFEFRALLSLAEQQLRDTAPGA